MGHLSADLLATSLAELEASPDSARQVVAAGLQSLTDVPVWIVSAADSPEATRSRRAVLAGGSRDGGHEIAPGTTHYVHYQQPALVADAILRAVTAAR